jgi:hypothetical protein
MKCDICEGNMKHAFDREVLGKYTGSYWNCSCCGYMKAIDPIWLEEAYSNSITNADVGLLSRNFAFSQKITALINRYLDCEGTYLDYAGGYGVFTRLMRDSGFNFLHHDIYTENLFAKGHVYSGDSGAIDGITCFECLEHFVAPVEEVEGILKISKNVFFSTQLKPMDIPDESWAYYGFEHGQHVSFYTLRALEFLAKRFDLSLVSTGYLHYFCDKSLSNREFVKIARGASKRPHILAKRTRCDAIVRRMKKSLSQ